MVELLRRIVNHSTVLARDQIELTKQELREKADKIRGPAIAMVVGVMICFVAFMSLCAAVIIDLAHYMSLTMAALITAAVLGLIGSVIAVIGSAKVRKQL